MTMTTSTSPPTTPNEVFKRSPSNKNCNFWNLMKIACVVFFVVPIFFFKISMSPLHPLMLGKRVILFLNAFDVKETMPNFNFLAQLLSFTCVLRSVNKESKPSRNRSQKKGFF